jgi:hypothetical protein
MALKQRMMRQRRCTPYSGMAVIKHVKTVQWQCTGCKAFYWYAALHCPLCGENLVEISSSVKRIFRSSKQIALFGDRLTEVKA